MLGERSGQPLQHESVVIFRGLQGQRKEGADPELGRSPLRLRQEAAEGRDQRGDPLEEAVGLRRQQPQGPRHQGQEHPWAPQLVIATSRPVSLRAGGAFPF